MERLELLVKNVPKLTPALENSFKIKYGAVTVRSFGRSRLVLRFPDERCTHSALQLLHQSELDGRILSAEYLGRRHAPQQTDELTDEPPEPAPLIADFVKALYATSNRHGFEQPPPPHLKYNYPAINRTILDSISIALLTNPKFYHQVLHLMNRMNLEPPFVPLEKPFVPPGEPCDAQTQTDFELASKLLASDESELESDDESLKIQINKNKRKKPSNDNVLKNKVRKIISAQLHEKSFPTATTGRKEDNIQEVFENNAAKNFGKKIALNVASVKLPEKQPETDFSCAPDDDRNVATPLVGAELKLNRISEQQWKDLAIFKNYQRGDKSNKLYVKNLSKDVTEEDLVNIYSRFVANYSQADISVKLMLYGKMKGQAFVTFNTTKEGSFEAIGQALDETNGYILKNKPMVVCFAKKS